MPIFWLNKNQINFPHPSLANEQGILAAGGDLSTERLLLAYQYGIFPWYNPDDPILWWSPNPRFVLFPEKLKIAKSMRPYFNQGKFAWTVDKAFEEVISFCKTNKRKGQGGGTWITDEMKAAYIRLHEQGYAHSVEVWQEGKLVGGLYGIALGAVFFGESMFAHVANASKFGFISLVQWLIPKGYQLIDCQQETNHLKSLGAESIPRAAFMELLTQHVKSLATEGRWEDYPPDQTGSQHLPIEN